MEWRCEWCEKPHEENDPPCENCGHGTFEKAVVRGPPSGGAEKAATTVWVCPECGREHPKHSPPCSRCGNATLEKTERGPEDYTDIGAASYRELVTPRYLLGVAIALVIATVFVLGVTGIVTVPGLSPSGIPAVDNVPGNATSMDGRSLEAVETELHAAINDRRESAGAGPLERNERLDEVARFFNQRVVKKQYGNGSLPTAEDIQEYLEGPCGGSDLLPAGNRLTPGAGYREAETPEGTATIVLDNLGTEPYEEEDLRYGRLGLDLHLAPDGQLYVMQFRC